MTIFSILPLLVIFVVGVIWLNTWIRYTERTRNKHKVSVEDYLAAEQQANFSPKRDIDEALFVYIDSSLFPPPTNAAEGVKFRAKQFEKSAARKMIRFEQSYTNRELKEQFGIAHFEIVVEYEQNFTNCLLAGNAYAEGLIEHGEKILAQKLLSELVKQRSDIGKTYTLLAELLAEQKSFTALETLKTAVSASRLQLKEKVLAHIDALLDNNLQ